MKGLLIFIACVLVIIAFLIVWSSISQERIDAQLEHFDQVLQEAEHNGK